MKMGAMARSSKGQNCGKPRIEGAASRKKNELFGGVKRRRSWGRKKRESCQGPGKRDEVQVEFAIWLEFAFWGKPRVDQGGVAPSFANCRRATTGCVAGIPATSTNSLNIHGRGDGGKVS